MLDFRAISEILMNSAKGDVTSFDLGDRLGDLIRSNMKTNQKLWDLEDSAKMLDLGPERIAIIKQEIDQSNQIRNDLISEVDAEIVNQMLVVPLNARQPYSESPGMIIDHLSILYIKLSVIRELLSVIEEEDLKTEYREKERVVQNQVDHLGDFLDSYLNKLRSKEAFFEPQRPVKIYNDTRIKKYIRLLQKLKNNS